MTQITKLEELEHNFTGLLLDLIEQKTVKGPRTYGFEYEFISTKPLNLELMEKLSGFLQDCGFEPDGDYFRHPSGLHITFEPGGQIEYHSQPLLAEDNDSFNRFLELIGKTNTNIYRELDIEYLATGYMPGRSDAPLCLKNKRYINLHARMQKCGSRGLEMMKGTASIHLHVGICDILELVPLFSCVCEMSAIEELKMGRDRRDIWDNTDPSRCGLPYHSIDKESGPKKVVEELVRVGLKADDIDENVPFYLTKDLSFDAFMYHMTTIFTDVRMNIKGPSIELRTTDSMPFEGFRSLWKRFISLLEII
ncbi:glutamate-cysteine ligase family protein [Thermodesulfobacteriota bacterium]